MALLRREGADEVAEALPDAAMAIANLAEVLGKLVDYGVPEPEAYAAVSGLGIAFVFLGSGLLLTRAAVERRAQAGAEMNALTAALAATADSMPPSSYGFVIVPDRIGAIPFARNGQGGLMLPPVYRRSLSSSLVVQLAEELPGWPKLIAANIVGRFKSEPLQDVTSPNTQVPGSTPAPAAPDRFYCWNTQTHALVSMPLVFASDYSDWTDVWARGLDAAGCRA